MSLDDEEILVQSYETLRKMKQKQFLKNITEKTYPSIFDFPTTIYIHNIKSVHKQDITKFFKDQQGFVSIKFVNFKCFVVFNNDQNAKSAITSAKHFLQIFPIQLNAYNNNNS